VATKERLPTAGNDVYENVSKGVISDAEPNNVEYTIMMAPKLLIILLPKACILKQKLADNYQIVHTTIFITINCHSTMGLYSEIKFDTLNTRG
jgi:hypothetical protein